MKLQEAKAWIQADPLRAVGVVLVIVASIGVLLWVTDTLSWLVASWAALFAARAMRKRAASADAIEAAEEAVSGLKEVVQDESWKEESQAVTVEEMTPEEKAKLGDELLGGEE